MDITFVVVAGLLCMNGICVDVPHDIKVHQPENWSIVDEKCDYHIGCAYLHNHEIWMVQSQGGQNTDMGTLFHELMHFEIWEQNGTHHDKKMQDRENAARRALGIFEEVHYAG